LVAVANFEEEGATKDEFRASGRVVPEIVTEGTASSPVDGDVVFGGGEFVDEVANVREGVTKLNDPGENSVATAKRDVEEGGTDDKAIVSEELIESFIAVEIENVVKEFKGHIFAGDDV